MNATNAGPAFRTARRLVGLGAEEFAGVLEISRQHLHRVESGRVAPSAALLDRFRQRVALVLLAARVPEEREVRRG